MKRLLAAVISTALFPFMCSANADSMGVNKDCNDHPVSQYGIDSLVTFSQYKAEPKKFMEVMTAFCNRGKTMGDMGFEAATNLSLTESKKWADSNLKNQSKEQSEFSSSFSHLLSLAMLNGYTGFDYPKPPEQKKELPSSLKPNEICDEISSKATERSTSQLPSQVKISLSEWRQIKSDFGMVCLIGIMNGNSHKPVDGKLIAGFNDIAREVFYQAYEIGSKYPEYRMPEINKAARKEKEKRDAAVREKAEAARQAATEKQSNHNREEYIKSQEEVHNFQVSLRNAFMQRIGNQTRFSGKKCLVNIWFSQGGEILSIKDESGDAELCSEVLKVSKGIKLNPMSNEVYKLYRNVPVDFKF